MGGAACLRKLLAIDPHAKVIMSTAYGGDDTKEAMRKAGACGFLAKPYRLSVLLREIEVVLNA